MPFKYFGRTTDFKGKTLWEIVGNLKNFGVGRIVTRSTYQRYPEPTYMKILNVQALANPKYPGPDNMRRVRVVVEKTFRGKKLPEPVHIEMTSYKPDYRLIPKDEEEQFCKGEEEQFCKGDVEGKVTVLPKYTVFPPLLRELIVQEMAARGEKATEPKLEVVYREDRYGKYRVAEEGETPSFEMVNGVGTPTSPELYKGLKL